METISSALGRTLTTQRSAALCALLLLVAACDGDVIFEPASAGGIANEGGDGGEDGEGGGSSDPRFVLIDCQAACATQGPGACIDASECESLCAARNGDWVASTAEAFAHCAQNEALCFETMDQCMWRELYPDGEEVTVALQADDLFPLNGETVFARLDQPGSEVVATIVEDGAIDIELPYTGGLSFVPSVLVFVDQNDDDVCNAGDLSLLANSVVSEPFHAPTVKANAELSQFLQGPDFCEFF